MDICTDINILKIIRIFRIAFTVLTYIIPIVLIVLITLDFFKAIYGEEKDLSKAISISLKRFVAAIVIFFVPTIVNAVFNSVNKTNTILKCYTNATAENIRSIAIQKAEDYINTVKQTYNIDDYNLAKNAISKIDDEATRKSLEAELAKTKTLVDYNQSLLELRHNINLIKTTYTEEKYNELVNQINSLAYDTFKSELLSLLDEAKKEYQNSIKPLIEPLNIEAGIHEKTDFNGSEMRYVEVIPEDATTKMPLVIYLHGIWAYEHFSEQAPDYLITRYVASGEAYTKGKFILIIPRVVLSQGNAAKNITWQTDQGKQRIKDLTDLINFIVGKYKIDSRRIYITGYSLGGDGTWSMVESNPNLFAAAVPISGCASDKAVISSYLGTSIRAYHGTGNKEDAYKTCVPAIYNKIKNAGGDIELHVKDGYSHGEMPNVYTESDEKIFEWLLEHTRK